MAHKRRKSFGSYSFMAVKHNSDGINRTKKWKNRKERDNEEE